MKRSCELCCVIGFVLSVTISSQTAGADDRAFRYLFSFRHDDIITCGDFSDDGKWLATGSEAGTIRVTDLDSRQHQDIRDAHTFGNGVQALRFTSDGKWLISGGYGGDSQGGLVKIWDAAARSLKATFQAHKGHSVKSLEVTSDARFLVSADDQQVVIWDLGTWDLKRRLFVPYAAIAAHGERTLAIGVGKDRRRVEIDRKFGEIRDVEWFPTDLGDLMLYDIEAGKVTQKVQKLSATGIISCRFRNRTAELLILSADRTVYRLDPVSLATRKRLALSGFYKFPEEQGIVLGSFTDFDIFEKHPLLLFNNRQNTFFLDLALGKAWPFEHRSAVGICLSRRGEQFAVLGGLDNPQLAPPPKQHYWTVSVFLLGK